MAVKTMTFGVILFKNASVSQSNILFCGKPHKYELNMYKEDEVILAKQYWSNKGNTDWVLSENVYM